MLRWVEWFSTVVLQFSQRWYIEASEAYDSVLSKVKNILEGNVLWFSYFIAKSSSTNRSFLFEVLFNNFFFCRAGELIFFSFRVEIIYTCVILVVYFIFLNWQKIIINVLWWSLTNFCMKDSSCYDTPKQPIKLNFYSRRIKFLTKKFHKISVGWDLIYFSFCFFFVLPFGFLFFFFPWGFPFVPWLQHHVYT